MTDNPHRYDRVTTDLGSEVPWWANAEIEPVDCEPLVDDVTLAHAAGHVTEGLTQARAMVDDIGRHPAAYAGMGDRLTKIATQIERVAELLTSDLLADLIGEPLPPGLLDRVRTTGADCRRVAAGAT